MNKVVNQIAEKDRVFGALCYEAEHSYKHENYFSAMACLFVISEQIIKHVVDKIDGNFFQAIADAKKRNMINKAEFELIDNLRRIRNKIFHENHYSTGIEIDGMYYPFDEDETKKTIYDYFSKKLFSVVLKLI